MNYSYYLPEGSLRYTKDNLAHTTTLAGLESAMRDDMILEATAIMCDEGFNLHVDLGPVLGFMPREECVLPHGNEPIKDIAIITRVGKPVCFKVLSIDTSGDTPRAILSRRAAQIECKNYYLSTLEAGDVIPATVTHLDTFGAFLDIGCGISSLLSIACISVSRISHPSDRLTVGQKLKVVVRTKDEDSGRIYVTLKELLGTWAENAVSFSPGQTVSGIVRSIESYGVFVELTPNLAGLAELRDDYDFFNNISIGDRVSVYIKSIIPDKMKIKLVIIDSTLEKGAPTPLNYFIAEGDDHISEWLYSPPNCIKTIKSVFV